MDSVIRLLRLFCTLIQIQSMKMLRLEYQMAVTAPCRLVLGEEVPKFLARARQWSLSSISEVEEAVCYAMTRLFNYSEAITMKRNGMLLVETLVDFRK